MKKAIVVQSSILGDYGQSNRLVAYARELLQAKYQMINYDFGADPLPYYDFDAATGSRNEPTNDKQKAAKALSDRLISELEATDLLVIAAPMYNLGVPAQLKTYIDYLNLAGRTFRYTENGPEGLIVGKKAVVILTSGGEYRAVNLDLHRQYLQAVLNFIGIKDVEFVYAEGTAYRAEDAVKDAKAELDRIVAAL